MSSPPPLPFTPPSLDDPQSIVDLVLGFRKLHDPVFFDLHKAPTEGPRLFVSNHSLFAVLDFPQLFFELYRERGIFLRSLGHSAHFKVPVWGPLMARYGAVEATRENCAALFEAGEPVLVFPGGGREAAKRKGEAYKLIWKERLGFARMAMRYGATVVPVAAYGAEHAWTITKDGPEVLKSETGPLLRWMMDQLGAAPDEAFPLVRGVGPTPWPRPERLYFSVGDPISTTHLVGQEEDDAAAWALRRQVEASINGQLAALEARRAADPERPFRVRFAKKLSRRLNQLEAWSERSLAEDD